eukprot:6174578-Pleurochrysis_carterae.AAC.2
MAEQRGPRAAEQALQLIGDRERCIGDPFVLRRLGRLYDGVRLTRASEGRRASVHGISRRGFS